MSQRRRYWAKIVVSVFIALVSSSHRPAFAQSVVPVEKATRAEPLVAKTGSGGKLRVIVGLRQSYQLEGGLDSAAASTQRRNIALAQRSLLDELGGYGVTSITSFEYVPFMAMEVDADALRTLVESDAVVTIQEDVAVPLALASTVPIVGADDAHALGFAGSGQTVAILDTGIEGLHAFFGGRIVSEACYSNASPSSTTASLCPNGLQTQTGTGSAEATTPACIDDTGDNICWHGSHVAGIAAGNGSGSSGIATLANIIAIQIFTGFDDCGTGSCVLSYTSDQIRGLERVYQLRDAFDIAAVNLSLAGEPFTSESSCDSSNTAIKSTIDLLRSVGIATVVAAGNGGLTNALTAPACISSAISVGATDDSDRVASFSASASFLDLLAPGVDVISSVPENTFASFSGTSMAAPHVTGAWAVYKQLVPDASVSTVEAALKTNGTSVTDSRNGITKPRLDIGKAVVSATAPSARITSLWRVSNANVGGRARLWARVENTGTVALPSDAKVRYWVTGPFWSGSHRVGMASVAGLAPGAARWKRLDWNIGASRPAGRYSYWARVEQRTIPISAWEGPQSFLVTGLAFDSTFSDSSTAWQVENGTWSIVSNKFFYTAGVPGQVSSISYPQTIADFDYEVKFWRNGSRAWNASRLFVRGAPNPLQPGTKNWNQAYLFQISKAGRYSVWVTNGATQTSMQSWTSSPAVHTSGWNTLRVRAVGSSLSFYINGTLVWSGTDTTFTAGRVGIGMYASPSSTGNGFWVDYAKLTVLRPSP